MSTKSEMSVHMCNEFKERDIDPSTHATFIYTILYTYTDYDGDDEEDEQKKMPIKFVVSAKIIIRNVNSISLERTTFCLHSPRHSFDLFHVMRAMHLSRSRSFFRFFSLSSCSMWL